jgi:hypothetical protein
MAAPVSLDDPELTKYLRTPRASSETLYAVTLPTFDALSNDEKKALLDKLQKFAVTQKLTKVSLLNGQGKAIAYASGERSEVIEE